MVTLNLWRELVKDCYFYSLAHFTSKFIALPISSVSLSYFCYHSDKDGKLALCKKQQERLGKFVRPSDICSEPKLIYAISSFSVRQVWWCNVLQDATSRQVWLREHWLPWLTCQVLQYICMILLDIDIAKATILKNKRKFWVFMCESYPALKISVFPLALLSAP